MSEQLNQLIIENIPNQKEANKLMSKMFEITKPEAVFSQPVSAGDYTIITASELTAGLGYGFGGGSGTSPTSEKGETDETVNVGGGGGGGGGGGTTARPVATIIIGPDGVRVEPIVDPTKITLAFFATIGSFLLSMRKLQRKMQRKK